MICLSRTGILMPKNPKSFFTLFTLSLLVFLVSCEKRNDLIHPQVTPNPAGPTVVNAPLFKGAVFTGNVFSPAGDMSGANAYFISGGDGGILYSADGNTWTHADTNGASEALFDLAFNPDSQTLLAVGSAARILKSTDGGLTWQWLESSSDYALTRIIYNETQKCWMTAGEAGLALMSCDDGVNWRFLDGLPEQNFVSILAHGAEWWLAGDTGVWRSTDNAAHWEAIYTTDENSLTGMYFLEQQNQILLTFSDARIAFWANQNWTEHKLASKPAWLTAVAANDKHIVITSSEGEVFVSKDAGRQWQTQRVSDTYLSSAAWLPTAKKFVIAGNQGTLGISDTDVEEWEMLDLATHSVTGNFEGLLALDMGQAFAAFGSGGQFVIQNLQHKQLSVVQQTLEGYVQDLLVLPQGRLIAAGSEGVLRYSDDAGQSWRAADADLNSEHYLISLAYLPENGVTLAAGPSGLIFRSSDAGKSWNRVVETGASEGYFHKLLFDPVRKQTLALASPGYTRLSRDAGTTWAATIEDFGDHLLNVAQNTESGRYIAVGRKGAMQISDDGLNWVQRPLKTAVDLYAVSYHSPSKRWFAAGTGGIIWTSEDEGQRWHASEGDPAQTIFNLKGVNETTLVATGSDGLLLVSQDAGDGWAQIDTGLSENLREPWLNYQQHIFIAGKGGSLLFSEDQGTSWSFVPTGTTKSLKLVRQIPGQDAMIISGERTVRLPQGYNE